MPTAYRRSKIFNYSHSYELFVEHLENRSTIHIQYSPRITGFYLHDETRGLVRTFPRNLMYFVNAKRTIIDQ
jgi:hypothetical protein